MTAQHHAEQHSRPEARTTAADATYPLGPSTLPKRTKVAAPASAQFGTV